jgi:hypothetical protein
MRSWEKGGTKMCAVNFSLPVSALAILRRHSPSPRSYGSFLARLLYEFEAREEERQKIRQELQRMVGE